MKIFSSFQKRSVKGAWKFTEHFVLCILPLHYLHYWTLNTYLNLNTHYTAVQTVNLVCEVRGPGQIIISCHADISYNFVYLMILTDFDENINQIFIDFTGKWRTICSNYCLSKYQEKL